ncbi:endonuclease/exonuclease/phosphatase family protein [Parabacteroides sp. AF17-3]|uniref:endonuclease/exonuclease/phosphatase family protein n=1 Tax=Parabacteroides sp. AF17-3 TaxID=2293113 RepID=UPI000EFDCACD|nr:endonuclease/exonuclease/phosphatase family protein [Parabacteroides sp. AF17-3]RKU68338.1 endonuclease/exonuclease/phosphatase family protein [Parabacteroides sp. AF17-3]
MKKGLFTTVLLFMITLCFSSCQKTETFKVLQFNIWQEGTVVENGFDAVADEIVRSDADFVTLSEVRNYHNTRFCDRIVEALQKRGQTYYSFYTEDSGLLSRYPISDSSTVYPLNDDRGSIYRLVTKKGDQEFAVYTAHLDYRNCAYYDARGYDGNNWNKIEPVTNLDSILVLNRASVRDDAIARFIKEAEKDKAAGRIVILGGDFNEPSHLDWTETTKDMRDHYGLVVPWDVSVMLEKAGYKDSYREKYPDPVTHPGFTCPADCPDIALKKLVWSPEADDRDRIDFIMYSPFNGLSLTDVTIIGPKGDILRGERVTKETADPVIEPLGVWPTDHKAILATFQLIRHL